MTGAARSYRVISGIPVPPRRRRVVQKQVQQTFYPFPGMKIGDCFIVPKDDPGWYARGPNARWHRVTAAAGQYGRSHGQKFVVRLLDDGSCGVWRTA